MKWVRELRQRFDAFRRRRQMNAEMTEEMRHHLELQAQENVDAGMSPEEARYAALRQFGHVEGIKETCRDQRGLRWLEEALQDVRFGFRQLRKNPGFALAAVLTLALGIGANTAIFSVVNAVVLRPLPYDEPERLVTLWGNFSGIGLPGNRNALSAPEFKDLESLSKVFSQLAVVSSGKSYNLHLGAYPQRVEGTQVSPAFFPMLRVPPLLGRTLRPADAEPGQESVVVISHGLWQRGFGADPGIIGRKLIVNAVSHEVVGVMPAGFRSLDNADIWAPFVFAPNDLNPAGRANHGLQVLARVRPDFTLEQARADLSWVSRMVEKQNPEYPYAKFHFSLGLTPLLDEVVGEVRKPLWILTGAVALVLLIACVNVANLLLVRASAREREVAVRVALGAQRSRLFRQWFTEGVVLSVLGGVAGLLAAELCLRTLRQIGVSILPRVNEATLDGRVLAFALLVSLGTGVLFGLAPGLRAAGDVGADTLRGGARNLTPGRGLQSLRHGLVVLELAISLILLTGAGLLIGSLLRVQAVDGGFRPENVLTMRVSLPAAKYGDPARAREFYREIVERLSSLPGVEAAGGVSGLPLSGAVSSGTTTMDSTAVAPDAASPEADQCVVTTGYFQAMGIPLLSGRAFELRDNEQAAAVAVVDETLARTFWPGESAVGKRLHAGGAGGDPSWATIVGVVRHVRSRTFEAASRYQVYWPEAQQTRRSLNLVTRTKAAPRALAARVQKEIASVDPDQPAYDVKTMEEWLRDSLALRRLGTLLLATFAGLALVLAAIGIYGVMAYWVGQRTHEIGLRMALGARQREVLRLVVGQGFKLGTAGVVLGLAGALVFSRLLASQLYDIHPVDPVTFLGVSVALVGVTLLACWLPARRAARVDPVVALRAE